MGIIGALLSYALVKGACNEIRIADQRYIDRKLKEIKNKYAGGRYEYMTIMHPRWDAYCDEVNPLRIKYGLEPHKKTDRLNPEEKKRRDDFIAWERARGKY